MIAMKDKEEQLLSKENHSASIIGMLNEKHLHAAVKAWYSKPGDRLEVDCDGYVIDIQRNDLVIEIQTRSFSKIRQKITILADRHPLRLVYPIPHEKWIIKTDQHGKKTVSRRKSPKHGTYEDLFEELVSFPSLIKNPNFTLEILLIEEEEIRIHDPHRAWRRRGWITRERRLLDVIEKRRFNNPKELMALFPQSIHGEFTTSDLAVAIQKSTRLARKMAYCLKEMGAILPVGKRGNAILYTRT
jgi:hypothetical protein